MKPRNTQCYNCESMSPARYVIRTSLPTSALSCPSAVSNSSAATRRSS